MKTIKGIRQNTSPEETPEGYGFFGKNVVKNKRYNELVNEDGTYAVDVIDVEDIVGQITLQNNLIIFYINTSNQSVITVLKEDRLATDPPPTINLIRADLAFNRDFPITGEAKLNPKGDIIVAFTDTNTPAKYINLTTATPADPIETYNLFLRGRTPLKYGPKAIDNGGVLATGAYFITIRYIDKDGAYTDSAPLSDAIYIVGHKEFDTFYDAKGIPSGQSSNKGIRLSLEGLSTNFTRFELIAVKVIGGVTSVVRVKEVAYSGSISTVTYTGGELETPYTIEEVVRVTGDYNTVDALTSLNDSLYLAGLTIDGAEDFQPLANWLSSNLKWISTPVWFPFNTDIETTEEDYSKDGNKRTFMHGEVYALYAQFEVNGKLTRWHHIPGRPLTATDKDTTATPSDFIVNGSAAKKFHYDDTTKNVSGSGTMNKGITYEQGGYSLEGEFGAWENESEVYPANFPDFAGENVRYHVMPSISWLREFYISLVEAFKTYILEHGSQYWDSLGLKVSNSSLPSQYVNRVTRIKFGYAKRGEASKLILGYDLHQASGIKANDGNIRVPLGGNWRIDNIAGVGFSSAWDDNKVRLHSPDVMIEKPNITDVYLQSFLKMTVSGLGSASPASSASTPNGRIRTVEDVRVYAYLSNFFYYGNSVSLLSDEMFAKLNKARYLPRAVNFNGEGADVFRNFDGEEVLYGEVPNPTIFFLGFGNPEDDVITGAGFQSSVLTEPSWLIAIKQLKSDVFTGYTKQQVVPIDEGITYTNGLPDSRVLRNIGDTFICTHSFMTLAPRTSDELGETQPTNDGIRCMKLFLLESRYNLNQRYQTAGDISTYFFPSGAFNNPLNSLEYWFMDIIQSSTPVNVINADKDYAEQNIFDITEIYDHAKEYETEFPHLIIRSEQANRDTGLDDGWRRFLPNNTFYTVRNKGRILNLEAIKEEFLLIHHTQGIFRTRGNVVLASSISDISIGRGDIFAIEPSEVGIASYGYGGTQHRFSCHLNEKGYFFADAERGEIFHYDLGTTLSPISATIRPIVENLLRTDSIIKTTDNPYQGKGIQIGYDKENYRILLSLRGNSSLTLSYDLIDNEWLTAHDYLPDGIFNTRNFMFSFKDKQLHRHDPNNTTKGTFYGITYPSYFDFIVNPEPTVEKVLAAISWISRVVTANATKHNETITSVTIWNEYGCTGKINLTDQATSIYDIQDKNTKNTNNIWRFDEIMDIVKDHDLPFINDLFNDYRPISSNIDVNLAWYEMVKFTGKYFIIRLEYSNIENKNVYLQEVLAELRESYR